MPPEDDATVRIRPQPQPDGTTRRRLWMGIAAVALAGGGAAGWMWLRPRDTADGQPVPVPEARAPELPIPLLDEGSIAAHRAAVPTLLRLRENPAIFVIDFPDLGAQGAALNRVAALIEKAGMPRDRIVSEAELAADIGRAGDTPATYYYGHNYRAADMQRFFTLADRDGIPLRLEERRLRDMLARARAEHGEPDIALMSLAAPDDLMDERSRRTILRHEIGHGHYFTLPSYAAHVRQVWERHFSEAERTAFRGFLAREGYDPDNEDLMLGETQAYLLFTPDERFFAPRHVGLPPEQVTRLRALLRTGTPLP